MKKNLALTLCVIIFAVFTVSCGDVKQKVEENDVDNTEVADELTDVTDEMNDEILDEDLMDESESSDEDVIDPCIEKECPENSTCVADGDKATCDCNEGYHPTNGKCISDTEMTEIGKFTVDFKGAINASNNPSEIIPGTGDATFTYFEEDFEFTVLHIEEESLKIDFPFAAVASGGMIASTWIDALSFTPKFFAINVPDDLEAGTDIDFVENDVYTLYGDLAYDGQNVAIRCVRAVSGEGKLEITELTDSQIEVSATGKLIDPVYASELGYDLPDICED